jgi:hypothetical protein
VNAARVDIGDRIMIWERGYGVVEGRIAVLLPATGEVVLLDAKGRHWRTPAPAVPAQRAEHGGDR